MTESPSSILVSSTGYRISPWRSMATRRSPSGMFRSPTKRFSSLEPESTTWVKNIQSLLAPAMVAVFTMGIFSKKITPLAGEWGLIGGFIVGMLRLATNVITKNGNAVMEGAFWESTSWFWQTNWLVFEIWLLVFIILLMVAVSFFTPAPSQAQVEAITFTKDYKKTIRDSWNKWDVAASLGVIALCGAFYYYFW